METINVKQFIDKVEELLNTHQQHFSSLQDCKKIEREVWEMISEIKDKLGSAKKYDAPVFSEEEINRVT